VMVQTEARRRYGWVPELLALLLAGAAAALVGREVLPEPVPVPLLAERPLVVLVPGTLGRWTALEGPVVPPGAPLRVSAPGSRLWVDLGEGLNPVEKMGDGYELTPLKDGQGLDLVAVDAAVPAELVPTGKGWREGLRERGLHHTALHLEALISDAR
jgi:hypothetical protein